MFDTPGSALAGTQPDHWSAIPFFGEHAQSADVRIAVEHYDVKNACWSFLGYLPPQAGDAALLTKWPRPGVFKLMPVSFEGVSLGEPKRITIDPQHELLTDQVVDGDDADAGGPVISPFGSGMSADMSALLERALAAEERRAEEDRRRLEAREAELRAREERVLAEHNSATGILQDRVGDEMSKILSLQAETSKAAQDKQAEGFAAILAMMQAQTQAQMAQTEARARADIERARLEAEARREEARLALEREQIRLEREKAELRERMEREEKRTREQAELQRAFMERMLAAENKGFERELQRTQDHSRAMLTLVESKGDPMAQIGAVVGTLTKAAETFGVDIKSVFGSAGQEASGGGTLATVVEAAVKALPVILASLPRAEAEEDDEEYVDDRVPVQLPNGVTILLDPEEHAKLTAARQQVPAIAGPVETYTQPVAPAPQPVYADPHAGMPGALPVAGAPGVVPILPPAAVEPPPPDGMTVEQVRAMRAETARIVGVLESQDPAMWTTTIITQVPAVPGLLAYLQAVTVAQALRDIAVDPDLARRILAACAQAGLPSDLVGVIS